MLVPAQVGLQTHREHGYSTSSGRKCKFGSFLLDVQLILAYESAVKQPENCENCSNCQALQAHSIQVVDGLPCCLPSLLLLLESALLSSPEQPEESRGLVAPLWRKTEVLHGEVAVGRRDLAHARKRSLSKESQKAKVRILNHSLRDINESQSRW